MRATPAMIFQGKTRDIAVVAPDAAAVRGMDRASAGIALLALAVAAWSTRAAPGWVAMWVLAVTEFLALKLLVLRGNPRGVAAWRIGAFVALWPGMDARRFL